MKTTYLKIQTHVSLLLALFRKNKHSSVSSPRSKPHGRSPRPSTTDSNRQPPYEIDYTYHFKTRRRLTPPPSDISTMGGSQPQGDRVSAIAKRQPIKRKQALVPHWADPKSACIVNYAQEKTFICAYSEDLLLIIIFCLPFSCAECIPFIRMEIL